MRKLGLAIVALFVAVLLLLCVAVAARAEPPGQCLSADEAQLVQLVNQYRVANGRPALPATHWLSTTGQWHAWDLINNNPVSGACNLHSWSAARPDLWQAVCYTADHAQAPQMWGKPGQISGGRYLGNGYELAAVAFPVQTPQSALLQWQGSPAHNAVILQTGVWAGVNLTGVGAGMLGSVAVLWFGDGLDPDPPLPACSAEAVFADGFEVSA